VSDLCAKCRQPLGEIAYVDEAGTAACRGCVSEALGEGPRREMALWVCIDVRESVTPKAAVEAVRSVLEASGLDVVDVQAVVE